MATLEFNFEGSIIKIKCSLNERIEEAIKKFTKEAKQKKEDLYFFYGGSVLNENLPFNKLANKADQERKTMSILVNKIVSEQKILKKSEYIICPECKERARILVDKYKFGFYDCKNGHKINNISIKDFEKQQSIDETKIICQNCNKANKANSYNQIFFICSDCNKNLCYLCKESHNKTHNIIDYYDNKFFLCDIHFEFYNSYCQDCKRDICQSCEEDHYEHKIISYGSILPKKAKEELNKFVQKKDELKNNIKNIINKLQALINNIDNY